MASRKHSTRIVNPATDNDPDEGKQACAQGPFCQAAVRDSSDGEWHGARTFQVYCAACAGRIATCLEELPAAFVRLEIVIGQRPKTGRAVRIPPGSRVLVRLEVDALQRLMAWVLGSWHERVAMIDRLAPPDMDADVHHPAKAVAAAVACLQPRVGALLALPLEPMGRIMYDPREAEEWLAAIDPDETGTVTLSGEAYMTPRLSGLHAGKEILELHYRARRILGEIRARPEAFDGVPCRECEEMALERAEPPSDPAEEAKHSRCAACRHEMTLDEFRQWTAMYKQWAEAVPGLSCKRCLSGRHSECKWVACSCRATDQEQQHAAA